MDKLDSWYPADYYFLAVLFAILLCQLPQGLLAWDRMAREQEAQRQIHSAVKTLGDETCRLDSWLNLQIAPAVGDHEKRLQKLEGRK